MYQSRSQLIRTSLSGNRRNHLTYNKLPVSTEKLTQYKQQLIRTAETEFGQRNKIPILLARQTQKKQVSQTRNTLVNFNETKTSGFNRARGISHRIMSSSHNFRSTSNSSFFKGQNEESTERPSTEFKTYRQRQSKARMNRYTPLQVIKTKMTSQNDSSVIMTNSMNKTFYGPQRQCQSELSRRNTPFSQSKSQKNFLKKGSAFDRSLITNILKSKFKQKIISSSASYSNSYSNALISAQIKKQIPRQFKDIIGSEEMLRMSKILTGINLKTINMDNQIQKAINSKIIKNKIKSLESDLHENQTLKSIKRW